jgi:hypothetical protein
MPKTKKAARETTTAISRRAVRPDEGVSPQSAQGRERQVSLFSAERLEQRLFLSAVTFGPPQNYATGGNPPSSITAADLGTGHPDLVVANESANTVSVLLGNGDGTFQTQKTYATGNGPDSVAVADLGNGHPDLVVSNGNDNTVSVLLGNDDGTFQAQKTYPTGQGPKGDIRTTWAVTQP